MLSTDTYLLIACPFWSYLYFPLYQTPWGSNPVLSGPVPNINRDFIGVISAFFNSRSIGDVVKAHDFIILFTW
jgi:hypothetical protein